MGAKPLALKLLGPLTDPQGIPIYLAMIFGHMYLTKSKGVKPPEVDFYSGKDIIDKEEQAFWEMQAARQGTRKGWNGFYDRYISFLF